MALDINIIVGVILDYLNDVRKHMSRLSKEISRATVKKNLSLDPENYPSFSQFSLYILMEVLSAYKGVNLSKDIHLPYAGELIELRGHKGGFEGPLEVVLLQPEAGAEA